MKKHTKVSTLFLAVAALSVSGLVQADVVGTSSNGVYVDIGESTVVGGPHSAGLAGIAVEATGIGSGWVDFQGLTSYGAQSNGVYNLNFPYTGSPQSHRQLGVFNFAQVGSDDVWFGEWSNDGTSNSTRTVYYSGADADTSVPSSGSATYTVVGINNYDGNADSLLNGTFTANFGAGILTGSIVNADGFGVNIGLANINSDASISGTTATASQSGSTVATDGAVSGQFYNGHSSLAGLVDFAGTQYDTAFGGSQD